MSEFTSAFSHLFSHLLCPSFTFDMVSEHILFMASASEQPTTSSPFLKWLKIQIIRIHTISILESWNYSRFSIILGRQLFYLVASMVMVLSAKKQDWIYWWILRQAKHNQFSVWNLGVVQWHGDIVDLELNLKGNCSNCHLHWICCFL